MNNLYVDPQTGVRLDTTFWRQDPWQSQEQFMQLPNYPAATNDLRNRVERQLRMMIQSNAADNQLRAYLYHQMSHNNWLNNDWGALVTSAGQLIEAEVNGRGVSLSEQNMANILTRALQVYLVRAVERDGNLAATLTQEQMHSVQQLMHQRNIDVELVEAFNRQRSGHMMSQPMPGYGMQNGQPLRQNSFMMNQVNTPQQAPNYNVGGYGQQQQPVVGNSRRSFDDIVNGATDQSMHHTQPAPTARQQNSGVFGNLRVTNPEEVSERAEGRGPQVLEEVHLSPHHGYVHQKGGDDVRFDDYFVRSEENNMPEVVQTEGDELPNFAMIDLHGKAYPLAFCAYRHHITENGGIMNYADHELVYTNIPPEESLPILPVYTKEEDATGVEKVEQQWLVESRFDMLKSPLVGLSLDTAFAAVAFRENSYFTGTVCEFIVTNTDAVLVQDLPTFKKIYGGLFEDNPEVDLKKLWDAVKDLEAYSQPLFRKIDRAATAACNVILGKTLGLDTRIGSYASDWMDLLKYLVDNYGKAQHDRFVDQMYRVHSAICCLAGDNVHAALLKHNPLFSSLDRQPDLLWNSETDNFRAANEKERDALHRFLTEVEGPLGFKQSFVQLVQHSYCCLVPVLFESLALELPEGELAVVYPSILPELAQFLNNLVDHAGGFDGIFGRIVIGTVDGVLLEIYPLPGTDEQGNTLIAIGRVEE